MIPGDGTPGPGRPKGVPNKATRELKAAILQAAEGVGEDNNGKDGLVGYLRRVAMEDVKAFSSLLGKVLPMQVTGEDGGAIHTITRIELVAPGHDNSSN